VGSRATERAGALGFAVVFVAIARPLYDERAAVDGALGRSARRRRVRA
jgi:hypothetical protein